MIRAAAPSAREQGGRGRFGGTDGNEMLTGATAAVLTVLLVVEGITIIALGRLLRVHMFVGLLLFGPVLLKLASTGYRFARYYAGARRYREKGPPPLLLRLLAPVLVATTVAVFATGVALLLVGHRSGPVLLAHKVAFIVWGACFAAHFLWHLPRAWSALTGGRRISGRGLRGAAVLTAIAGGLGLALAALSLIGAWQRFRGG